MSYRPQTEMFGGRIDRLNATTLRLSSTHGPYVYVSGELVNITVPIDLVTTDNRIDGAGGDALAALAASTLYYIYVSNSKATTFPNDLRASTVTPTTVNGVRYLGSSGNALNWRFCGYLLTDASTNVTMSNTHIGVLNAYNKRLIRAGVAPAYADGSTATSYTKAAGNWSAANGGTGSRITFIADGLEAVDVLATALCVSGAPGAACIAIGLDTTTDPDENGTTVYNSSSVITSRRVFAASEIIEGAHTVDILVAADTNTATYYADDIRRGASADPAGTRLELMMRG